MIRVLPATLLLAALTGVALAEDKTRSEPVTTTPHRVFELRTYTANDGKLADVHKRFRDHACELLKKHGAELIGFWTPQDDKDGKESKLIYLVAFPDREAARKTWQEFSNDPEWKKVYAESQKNGVLVRKVESVFLEPTDYSPIK
jgi:uncharacterized protein (DUF1330 family)